MVNEMGKRRGAKDCNSHLFHHSSEICEFVSGSRCARSYVVNPLKKSKPSVNALNEDSLALSRLANSTIAEIVEIAWSYHFRAFMYVIQFRIYSIFNCTGDRLHFAVKYWISIYIYLVYHRRTLFYIRRKAIPCP